MNATQLFAHFDRLAEAPDAVPRLRRFILDLAVRGKLVEQDAVDEPAYELVKQIRLEKGRLIKSGIAKNVDDLPPVRVDEQPFQLPDSWTWVRLVNVLTKLTDGTHFSPANAPSGEFKYITAKNIKPEGVSLANVTYVSAEAHAEIYGRCDPSQGDILYIKDGATTGVVTINNLDEPFSMLSSVALLKVPNGLFNRLLVEFLRSPFFFDQMRGFMKGAAIPRVTLKRMGPALLPLPPLAEQHRIVAKVDELMALCDQLEAAQQEREHRRDRLAAASLQRLNQPTEANPATDQTKPAEAREQAQREQQKDHARFHLQNLNRLTTRPEHIKAMRQTILNLAVRGFLSENRDWASQPQQLRTVATLQNGYAFKSEWFAKSGIRLLRNTNVSHGVIRWDDLACLSELQSAEYERFRLLEGDIVLSLDRPFIATGTKVARVRAKDLPCLLLQRVGRFQLNSRLIATDYLFLLIESPQFTDQIDPGRSNGVPHISSKQVESAEIFLPPLAEQHRIVAKVDELMALCDQLEARLTQSQNDSRRLLEAVLEAALTPA
jgi:type I restriction enzyme, S subunit